MKKQLNNYQIRVNEIKQTAVYYCYEKTGNTMQYTILNESGDIIARLKTSNRMFNKMYNDELTKKCNAITYELVTGLTEVNDRFIDAIFNEESEKIGNYYLPIKKQKYTEKQLNDIARNIITK